MGLATAKLLASRGSFISLADINEAAIEAACESLPISNRHMCRVIDVCSSQSVDAWIEATLQRFGKLDGAVNMAGIITPAKPVAEETDETWDLNFAVNARGVFCCMRAQIWVMTAGGSIVSLLVDLINVHAFAEHALCRCLRPAPLARWDPQVFPLIAPVKRPSLVFPERRQRRTHTYGSTVWLQVSSEYIALCWQKCIVHSHEEAAR